LKRRKERNEGISVSWHPAELANENVGHGYCIYAKQDRQQGSLAAFVEGFGWCRGQNRAVIRFDPQSVPADEQEFAAFKAAIEARIRAGGVAPSEIVPGYWGIANA
jgi:hypothetical protein